MIQSVDADFTSLPANGFHHVLGDLVPDFRYQFKRRFDSILLLNLEHRHAKILPHTRLNIVGHDGARAKGFGPVPNEGNLFRAGNLKYPDPQPVDKILDRGIHWPGGEGDFRPVLECDPLQMLSDLNG